MPPTAADRSARTRDRYAVRFHLHPSIKATRLTDGRGVMLMAPNKEVWTFSAHDDHVVELEDSVYLAGSDGPRRSVQMVIYGQARDSAARGLELPAGQRRRRRRQRHSRAGARGGAEAADLTPNPPPLRLRSAVEDETSA